MKWLAFILALSAAPLAAQAPPASERIAHEIVETAYAPASGKQAALAQFEKRFVESFTAHPQGAALAKQRPDVMAVALKAGQAEFARQFDLVVVPAMTDAVVGIYVATFTPEQLDTMRTYYRSAPAKRFHASFAANADPAEAAAARADPVVTGYRASEVGLKETALSSQIADAMMTATIASTARFMPQVQAKIAAALQALPRGAPRAP